MQHEQGDFMHKLSLFTKKKHTHTHTCHRFGQEPLLHTLPEMRNLSSHVHTSACQHHELLEMNRHRHGPPPTAARRACPVACTESAESLASVGKDGLVEPLIEILLLLQGARGALRPVST